MQKSTHRVEVVPVTLEPHPNADSLSIVRIYGYTCVVRTEEWQGRNRGAYIVPDSVVPDAEPFAFLDGHRRIRVRRFRGVLSQGLLMPAPACAEIGDDVAELLGITRYEPPSQFITGGEAGPSPDGIWPHYDVEDWHRYRHTLRQGEDVVITEKLHGTSARYVYTQDEFFVGSRTEWKRRDSRVVWWQVAENHPWIIEWCRSHPHMALYGEVYGSVQSLKYGAVKGQAWFRAFDICERGQFLDWSLLYSLLPESDRRVPMLYMGPYDQSTVEQLSRGNSIIASHMREGCVVRPIWERSDPEIGRVQLKIVSDDYLEKGQ